MSEERYVSYTPSETVTRAIETRRSLRAFTQQPVDCDEIRVILDTAGRAPSGTNMQPWQTMVVTGQTRQQLCDAVCEAFDTERGDHTGEKQYYPSEWFEPYVSRRRKVGWDLYGLLEITRDDKQKMHDQHRRNFQFFDAPVGLIFTIHRDLATGSWLDYGMYLQNVMLLARERGLHSCPQAAWADFHRIIRNVLPVADSDIVVCGMALGYADDHAIENTLVTEREPVELSARFFD